MIKKLIFGPPDYLVHKFDSRTRRAFGFWTLVLSAGGAIFWGRTVLYVSVVSVLALVPNFSSETPVEKEED
jgi:hypothetical protein